MTFPTAVDWWYYALIGLIVIVLAISLVPQVQHGRISFLPVTAIVLVSVALPIWLAFSTYYRVDSDPSGEVLVIRSGPFSWRVPVSEIRHVTATRNPLSSPALSLNRLKIEYANNRTILISPKDREGFARAIGHDIHSN